MIENKYSRWYHSIIENARAKTDRDYTERHHIIPKCLGGTENEDNLVFLSYREHFLCHWLLTKFTAGLAKRKMYHALSFMCSGNFREKSSWKFEIAKRAVSEAHTGIKRSKETLEKMSQRVFSDETREKMSQARRKRITSDETRLKMSLVRKGKPKTQKTRDKMSSAQKGRVVQESAKVKQSLAMKGRTPWNKKVG